MIKDRYAAVVAGAAITAVVVIAWWLNARPGYILFGVLILLAAGCGEWGNRLWAGIREAIESCQRPGWKLGRRARVNSLIVISVVAFFGMMALLEWVFPRTGYFQVVFMFVFVFAASEYLERFSNCGKCGKSVYVKPFKFLGLSLAIVRRGWMPKYCMNCGHPVDDEAP